MVEVVGGLAAGEQVISDVAGLARGLSVAVDSSGQSSR